MRAYPALLLTCAFSLTAWSQCGTEEERIVTVRERLVPDLPKGDLEFLRHYLEMGTRSCSTSGDLWYYRSLLEKRVGTPSMASYSLQQAGKYRSEALRQHIDPFQTNDRLLRAGRSLPAKVREKWALVVGIDQFQDTAVPALQFPAKDAGDVAGALTDPKYGRFKQDNVKLIVNAQATVRGIREGIGWLRERVKPDDLVVIFISTHGSPKTLDSLGMSYLIANDTELAPPAKLYSSSYQMVDFVEDLNRDIPARRLAVFIDTCHSGDAIRRAQTVENESPDSAAGFSGAFRSFELGAGRAVLTASRAEEQSWESSQLQNGYFTHFLVEALHQKDGMATLAEIAAYVRDHVKASVAAEVHRVQTPVFSASENGDGIVLGS